MRFRSHVPGYCGSAYTDAANADHCRLASRVSMARGLSPVARAWPRANRPRWRWAMTAMARSARVEVMAAHPAHEV